MMALLPLLLARWRLFAGGAALMAALVAGTWIAHRLDAPARVRAGAALAAARADAASAHAAADLQSHATTAVETARTTETHTTARAGALADALSHAPAGDAPLAPDVLRDWAAAVDGLRDDAAHAHAAAAGSGGGGAARAVPAT